MKWFSIASVIGLAAGIAGAQTASKSKGVETAVAVSWKTVGPEENVTVEDARLAPHVATSRQISAALNTVPFGSPAPAFHREAPAQAIEISAQLKNAKGEPVPFQPVKYTLKTSMGSLDFGTFPTDADGRSKLVIRDRRFGQYAVNVSYPGDDGHQASLGETTVDFGARPEPALPEEGVLISPTFSASIGVPFLGFYGIMWVVFAYVIGYLLFVQLPHGRTPGAR